MNKNIGKNMGIVAVSAFSIQLIFKLMGNGNKASVIQGVLIIVLCIVLAVYMYGATKKKLGNKVSMVGAILLSATGISIAVGYIIMECYPELYKQYRALDAYIDLGSFIALMIFFIIAAIIVSNKNHK